MIMDLQMPRLLQPALTREIANRSYASLDNSNQPAQAHDFGGSRIARLCSHTYGMMLILISMLIVE